MLRSQFLKSENIWQMSSIEKNLEEMIAARVVLVSAIPGGLCSWSEKEQFYHRDSAIGLFKMRLGAGRVIKSDKLDYETGNRLKKVGETAEKLGKLSQNLRKWKKFLKN